jgi:hypothetical protein
MSGRIGGNGWQSSRNKQSCRDESWVYEGHEG